MSGHFHGSASITTPESNYCALIHPRKGLTESIKKWVLKPPAYFQEVLSGSPDTNHERYLPGVHRAPECAFAAPDGHSSSSTASAAFWKTAYLRSGLSPIPQSQSQSIPHYASVRHNLE